MESGQSKTASYALALLSVLAFVVGAGALFLLITGSASSITIPIALLIAWPVAYLARKMRK